MLLQTDEAVAAWLRRQGWDGAAHQALAGDASTRRYRRLRRPGATAVLMQCAAGDPDTRAFLRVAGVLRALGVSVPEILAEDADLGLVLLEDLGPQTYAEAVADGAGPQALYELAVDLLIHLHRRFDPASAGLPVYDAAEFSSQLALFCDDFLPAVGRPLTAGERDGFAAIWSALLAVATAVPQSFLHRDFHAGNLFLLPQRQGVGRCGVIDFQDAGSGPVAYDLVSLLEDARRDLPPALRQACLTRYLAAFPDLDGRAFQASFEILAVLRHLRVIAVFVRLAQQGKRGYLPHLDRLWRYLSAHLATPRLSDLRCWLDLVVPAQARGIPPEL